MNLIFLFIYLFNFKSNTNKLLGIDSRFPLVESNSSIYKIYEIRKIHEIHEKKKLLDYLQSSHIATSDKIKVINKYTNNNHPKPFNIFAGGLLNKTDWNF